MTLQLKDFSENHPELTFLWKSLVMSALAYRPHWHLMGVRAECKLGLFPSEQALYDEARGRFEDDLRAFRLMFGQVINQEALKNHLKNIDVGMICSLYS